MMFSSTSLVLLFLVLPESSRHLMEAGGGGGTTRTLTQALAIVPIAAARASAKTESLATSRLSMTSTKMTNKSPDLEAYHLIWSKGAKNKVALSLMTAWACHVSARYLGLKNRSLPAVVSDFAIPMLASSCCVLQLALNMISVGCAGFNTILGPARPYFIGLLGYLSIVSAESRSMRWLSTFSLRWAVSLLPEAIHLWNNWSSRTTKEPNYNRGQTYQLQATVRVEIPTMGCVACINTIDSALKRVPYVLSASSSLNPLGIKGGTAEAKIQLDDKQDVAMINELIVKAIEQAGFDGGSIISTKFS